MTCTNTLITKDMLSFIIFGSDTNFILGIVKASVQRMHEITSNEFTAAMKRLLDTKQTTLSLLKALFFLLLNVDMTMKELVVNTHMQQIDNMSKEKAKRFFMDLRNITVPNWIKNPDMDINDFLNAVKQLYLNS
jgi:hypothetical protein